MQRIIRLFSCFTGRLPRPCTHCNRHISLGSLLAFIVTLNPFVVAGAATINSSEYFPLADGNSWAFNVSTGGTNTLTVQQGTTLVNGAATKALMSSDGTITNLTSDTNGIREHREFDPEPPATTITYSPPFVFAAGVPNVPETVNGSGTATINVPSMSGTPFVYSYTVQSSVEAFETITVPAGTFDTVRVRTTLRIFGTSQGVAIDETETLVNWVARHIGLIKSESTSSDGTETEVLTSTNVTPPRVQKDFDGNGMSDILWRNQNSGQNVLWFMNGTTLAGSGAIVGLPDLNWQVGGVGDFNGDGETDILWRHTLTGQNVIWLMNGTALAGSGAIIALPDLDWQVGGVGDFNGDGKADILWRHGVSGQNVIWLMNGTALAGSGAIIALSDLDWQAVGIGDFNGDGKTDILWRHGVTGQNVIWLMNGTALAGSGAIIALSDQDWQAVCIGDFNGDGKADILWRHAVTGQNVIWLMNGTILDDSGVILSLNTTWRSH